jgi:hypothetical protein
VAVPAFGAVVAAVGEAAVVAVTGDLALAAEAVAAATAGDLVPLRLFLVEEAAPATARAAAIGAGAAVVATVAAAMVETATAADLVPMRLLLGVGAAAAAAAVAAAAVAVTAAAAAAGVLARLLLSLAAAVAVADLATLPFLEALRGAMVEVWCELIGVNLYNELEVVDVASDALSPTSRRKRASAWKGKSTEYHIDRGSFPEWQEAMTNNQFSDEWIRDIIIQIHKRNSYALAAKTSVWKK